MSTRYHLVMAVSLVVILALWIVTHLALSAHPTGDPDARFTPSATSVCPTWPITFTNLSTGTAPITFHWTFGDGGESWAISPVYSYTLAGTYTVALTATNALGSDVATATIRVDCHNVHLPLVLRDHRPPTQVEYGANLADLGNADLMNDIGFTWVKGFVEWGRAEPSKGHYFWDDVDNVLTVCQARGLKLIFRVDRPPAWANGSGGTAPPTNAADYGDFMGALAAHCRGQLTGIAYEVWNEPNLEIEWGGQSPDPARYVGLLQAAYPRVKAADPNARVVTAGLATTGGSLATAQSGERLTMTSRGLAWNDLHYIQAMYDAGARGYFDALGSHPYGFAYAPAQDPTTPTVNGLCFRRAEQQHAVMAANGDGDTPIWATEFGWLLDPATDGQGCSWPGRDWQKVSAQTQATYLVDAYAYARQNWPWMGVMCVFNLDFGADYYQAGCPSGWNMCNDMRYYSLVYRVSPCDPGNSPRLFRPAYGALKAMPKN